MNINKYKDKFSPLEFKTIQVIKNFKEIKMKLIHPAIYMDEPERPLNPTTVISITIKRVIAKCEAYNLPFTIEVIGNKGSDGKTVRLITVN